MKRPSKELILQSFTTVKAEVLRTVDNIQDKDVEESFLNLLDCLEYAMQVSLLSSEIEAEFPETIPPTKILQ